MANVNVTISALAPVLYSVAQEVSSEPFGVVDAINRSFDNKGVAKGDEVSVPFAPVQSTTSFTPSNVTPEGVAQTAGAVAIEITKSQKTEPMALTGEQIRSLENGGNWQEWVRQWAAQSMRALRNEAEADAAVAVYQGASRATGVAGTTPFASDLSALVNVRKILRDNGMPFADPQFVMDTAAEVNLLNLGIIQQAQAAGSDVERRSGFIGRQFGFQMRTSAGITEHTSGAAASYVLDVDTSIAKGTTTLVVKTGTDGINVGDVFTVGSGTDMYVVVSRDPATTVTAVLIGRPGTRAAYLDDAALTFTASYVPNLAFERSAIVGVIRPPIVPANPTINQMMVTDGSGLPYLVLDISQYGQRTWEMHMAWGFKVVQPEHVAILQG
jgi:hypothetical protein